MVGEMRDLDRIDREILARLQHNARLTNKDLAQQIGLSPSAALARVARLEEEATITGYSAHVAPRAVGLPLAAVVFVQFQTHKAKVVAAFNRELIERPEVVQLYYIGGAQDLVVHVLARDAEHLRKIVTEDIASHPEVRHVETNIVFEHAVRGVPTQL